MRKLQQLHLLIASGFIFLIGISGRASDKVFEDHVQVSLRMVGHELLLAAGDSTSRVLPIVEEKDGYRIRFENEFSFDPGQLVYIANGILKKVQISEGYIVSVEDCESDQVVYSYKAGVLAEEDLSPCNGRELPKGCYELVVNFLNVQEVTKSPVVKASKEKPVKSSKSLLFWGTLFIPIAIALVVARRKKSEKQKETHLVPIGNFQLNQLKSELLFEKTRIELTGKEVALLQLLLKSLNTTVKREEILREVWGDDGDYVGRTLDVFISKLRKKFEADESVRIVNERGVGYKLVVG